MAEPTNWKALGLPETGNAFTGCVPKGGASGFQVDKEAARLERKRAYEREYNKARYHELKQKKEAEKQALLAKILPVGSVKK